MTDQIMSMYGSQEGMAHIGLVLCDPGDVMLVPNPGYPVFGMGPQLMGAKVETYPLYKENNFIPDFNDIPEETARKAKFMIISTRPIRYVLWQMMIFMRELLHLQRNMMLCFFMTMHILILYLAERRENHFCLIQEQWRWALSFIPCLNPII